MNLPRPVLMSAAGFHRSQASWASALVLWGAMVFLAFTATSALADEYAEVGQLLRAGKAAEALARADQYLATKPRDPQMRFIKGVIQSETGRSQEAIATFQRLTEDYPELPEPYNNLAVLYANQNQFDRARSALEMAIRTNPSYSTAHENLGDVYARLASQAYSRALQLDGANAGVPPKLALIRDLFSLNGRSPAGAAAASAPPATGSAVVAANTPAAAISPVVPSTPSQPAVAAGAATGVAAGAATASPTVVAAAPAQQQAAQQVQQQTPQQTLVRPPSSASAGVSGNAQQDVSAAIRAWAAAWAAKDMGRYLGAYSREFSPPGGQSRAEWETERAERILSKTRISVVLSDVQVSATNDRATARFRQAYSADGLRINSRKTLELSRTGERWLIVRESTGG
jgi:Flp pilus assembly protein TadD